MRKNPRLDFVKRELAARPGKLKAIASKSNVAYTTVKNIAAGIVKDPRGSNLDALYEYLQRAA